MDGMKTSTSTMSLLKCACIITGFQIGSAVLTLPGIISELGWISFLMVLLFLGALNMYSIMLAIFAFDKVLKEKTVPQDDDELQRQPFQVYCRHAFGSNSFLTTLFMIIQTLAHLAVGIIFILIASVTLKDLVNLPMKMTSANETRIWIVVIFFILLLPSMLNSYREMGCIAFLAVLTIILAVIVVVISAIYIALSPISIDEQSAETARRKQVWLEYNPVQIMFSTFGTINLTFAGYMQAIPNLSVILLDTESLLKATFFSSILLYIVYIIAGCVPYFLLRTFVIDASVVTTILRISNEYGRGTILHIMTKLVALLITVHFLLVSAVNLNPIYLTAEKYFRVADEFSLKKFILRSCILLGLTIFTLIFPMLSQVISWLGGGIFMVYGLVVPMVLYLKLCESTLWTKCFCCLLAPVIIILIVGVNIVEIKQLF